MNNTVPKNREVVSLSNKPTLIISERLHSQINTLHQAVGKCEWSAALFLRRLEGDISRPSELVYRAEVLMLGDIGSATYTEFEFGESTMQFYEAYEGNIPDVDDLKMGLVHTHHNMSTFFSGTDMAELQDNAPNHNYYISLIVNFDADYKAKLAFVAKRNATLDYIGSEGEEAVMNLTNQEVLVTMDFNIVMSTDQYLLDSIAECRRIQTARRVPKPIVPVVRPLIPANTTPPAPKYTNQYDDLFDDNTSGSSLNFVGLADIEDKIVEEFLTKVISLNPTNKNTFKDTTDKLFKLKAKDKLNYPLLITDKIILDAFQSLELDGEITLYEMLDLSVIMLDDLQHDNPEEAELIESIIKVLEDCYEFKQ